MNCTGGRESRVLVCLHVVCPSPLNSTVIRLGCIDRNRFYSRRRQTEVILDAATSDRVGSDPDVVDLVLDWMWGNYRLPINRFHVRERSQFWTRDPTIVCALRRRGIHGLGSCFCTDRSVFFSQGALSRGSICTHLHLRILRTDCVRRLNESSNRKCPALNRNCGLGRLVLK